MRDTKKSNPRQIAPKAVLALSWLMIAATSGCGDGNPKMGSVTGKVTYSDGSIPKGGVAVIRFEPAAGTTAEIQKAASSEIQTDGTYELMTVRPADGALYGKYKVVFTILESYRTEKPLIAEKYANAETTPFEHVVDSASQQFDFEIEKAAGQ